LLKKETYVLNVLLFDITKIYATKLHDLYHYLNTKFTPKHYWNDNPLKRYLQNRDLCDIWNILNNKSKTLSENS
ncbi:21004_t:CDS:1, partial [Gigaspora margarita]